MAHVASRPGHHSRRTGATKARLAWPVLLLGAVGCLAIGFVGYLLWPRWPGVPVTLDAPTLPIMIGGTAFNVPPAAIRVPVQRRAGAQERVDLMFLWPSLTPPDPAAAKAAHQPVTPASLDAPPKPVDRIFVTLAASDSAMAPFERAKTIYPRYTERSPTSGPDGLAVLGFREDTPYRGEDLIYDAHAPERFVARCTRDGTSAASAGTCLFERRLQTADITVRFPRAWLDDWRNVSAGIERLIGSLRPTGR